MKKLSIALAAVLAMAGAQAATVVQTGALNLQTTEINQSFAFNLFNPALGTLTGITLKFDGEITESGSLQNTAAQSQSFGFTSSGLLFLSGALISSQSMTLSLYNFAPFSINLAAGATQTLTPVDITNTLSISPTNFAAFTGSGTTSLACQSAITNSTTGGGGNITTALNTKAGCGVTLTYTYTPTVVTVPEPSSLALVGLALAGAGMVARRRKA